jgi:MFS family permease
MHGGLRALQYPSYRLFFFGQAISLIGTWLQNVGMSWLVYRITGSAVLLGTVQFAMLMPSLVISPFAGVWVDRMDRKKLLLVTQALMLVQASILAAVVMLNVVQVWHLLLLAAGLGIVAAFDAPGRQTLVAEIIKNREDLPNAIALNSFLFNFARLIGPAIAGVLISSIGEGPCFALNAGSYIPVIFAITLMNVPYGAPAPKHRHVLVDLKEGWAYVRSSLSITSTLSLLAVASLVGGAYSVLLPIYAKEVFHGGANTLGLLYSGVGLGAVAAGVALAARKSLLGIGKFLGAAAFVFGAALMALSGVSNIAFGLVALAGVGFGAMAHMTATNTLVQSLTEDRMRGRVMAFFTMSFVGTMPIGSFASGVAAELVGPRIPVVVAGFVVIVATLMYLRVLPKARAEGREYLAERGLIPTDALAGDTSCREAILDAQPGTLTDEDGRGRFFLK